MGPWYPSGMFVGGGGGRSGGVVDAFIPLQQDPEGGAGEIVVWAHGP